MESAQKEIMSVLLKRLFDLGYLSKHTYQGAEDLVHSMIDFPDFFGYPVRLKKEREKNAGTQDSG
jgi:hypothetical protein